MQPIGSPQATAYAKREVARAGVRAAAIVAAYFAFPFGKSWVLGVILYGLLIVGLFPFTIKRFKRVMTSEHAVGDAISALLMTMVILIITFASTYYMIASHDPGSINGLSTKLDALYFETTILSTVGFGDITAATQWARGVTTLNMLINLLYIGTTLRLLTWAVQHRVAAEITQGPITRDG